MNKRLFVALILILLVSASAISLLQYNEMQSQRLPNRIKIIILYQQYNPAVQKPPFEYVWQYNTALSNGLEYVVIKELDNLGLDYETIRFEKATGQNLNATFLDSGDLIIIGGIFYWWHYSASNEDMSALLQTSTPILASISYGVSLARNSSILQSITGVSSNTSTIKVGTNIISASNNIVNFTECSPPPLVNFGYSYGFANLINTTKYGASRVYAFVLKDNLKYPLLIFNGTKNFLINAFTYEGTSNYDSWELAWPKLVLLSLNEIFDLLPEDVLYLKLFPKQELIVLNIVDSLYLILDIQFFVPSYILLLLIVSLLSHKTIKLDFKSKRRSLRFSLTKFKVALSRVEQGSLILLLVILIIHSVLFDVPEIVSFMLIQSSIAVIILIVLNSAFSHYFDRLDKATI